MAEPIDLDKLSVSLAASMVSAHRYLLQANQELEELYKSTETLGAIPLPRFTLDSVTFEVNYVVDAVTPPVKTVPPEVRLTKDVALSATELRSLQRGASVTAVEELQALVSDYAVVKKSLATVVEQAADEARVPPVPRVTAAVQVSEPALSELVTGASKTAVTKLSQLKADYEASRTALVRMREVLSAGSTSRLAVRIDAESLGKSPASVNKMVLKFGADDRPPVNVEGQNIP